MTGLSLALSSPSIEYSFSSPISNASRRYEAGETVCYEGDHSNYYYQVAGGVLKEYNTLEDGRRQIAEFYRTGDLFGIDNESACFFSVEAVTDAVVRRFPREAYLQMVAHDPRLSKSLVGDLMLRLRRAHERMIMLSRMSAAQRVAIFLMRLWDQRSGARTVNIDMSRQDIADHLGLTIETVCRCLTDLKRKGIIYMPTARTLVVPEISLLETVSVEG